MRDDAFGAARVMRKKPALRDMKMDDVTESPIELYSFAIKVTYIGKESKSEVREYLWHNGKSISPDILKGATLSPIERELNFKIPDAVIEEIKQRGEDEEKRFHSQLKVERAQLIEHLSALAEEKRREEKIEEAERIEEEIERRKDAPFPELRVRVEPVALMLLEAPLEIHRTVLENEFTRLEVVWEFDNLTGECDLKCNGCGRKVDEYFLTVDGLACKDCLNKCKECGKPMIHAEQCKVCHEHLCEEHVHHCSTCGAPLCEEHAERCKFCSNEMCPEHVNRCSVCNAPLCEEHTFRCSVCGTTIGPRHTRICDSCGKDVCPEHIHRCEICGKNVCENCGVEINGKWYCREHLEKTPLGVWVIPKLRCSTCGVALSEDEANHCKVCGAPLCEAHTNHCDVCNVLLCERHTHHCDICGASLCDEHVVISELSGREYCREHAATCSVCGRQVGTDELKNGVCPACMAMEQISRKNVPREIFAKYPYVRHSRAWFISRGKNTAYITEFRGRRFAYRVINGEIKEFRSQ